MQALFPSFKQTYHPECLNSPSRLLIFLAESGKVFLPLSILAIPPTCHCQICRIIRGDMINQSFLSPLHPFICQKIPHYSERFDTTPMPSLNGAQGVPFSSGKEENESNKSKTKFLTSKNEGQNVYGNLTCILDSLPLEAQTQGRNYRGLTPNYNLPIFSNTQALCQDNVVLFEDSRKGSYETSRQRFGRQMIESKASNPLPILQPGVSNNLVSYGANFSKSNCFQTHLYPANVTTIHSEPISTFCKNYHDIPAKSDLVEIFYCYGQPVKLLGPDLSSLPSLNSFLPLSSHGSSKKASNEVVNPVVAMKRNETFHKRIATNQGLLPQSRSFKDSVKACQRKIRRHYLMKDNYYKPLPYEKSRAKFLKPKTQGDFVCQRRKRHP